MQAVEVEEQKTILLLVQEVWAGEAMQVSPLSVIRVGRITEVAGAAKVGQPNGAVVQHEDCAQTETATKTSILC
jgi:hypothetical protein